MKYQAIKRNNSPHWLSICSLSLLAVLSLRSAINNFAQNSELNFWLGLVGAALFSFSIIMLVNSIRKILNTSLALEITEKGIVDHISHSKLGLIEWKHIDSVKIDSSKSKNHLIFSLGQEINPITKLSGLGNYMQKEVVKNFGNAIMIPEDRVKIDILDLKKLIQKSIEGAK